MTEMSMGAALTWQAEIDPDRPALTMGGVTYTRLQLDRAANRLARTFAERGVVEGDRVVVVLPTGPRHQITCFALWKLGATVIPLPSRIAEAELRHLVEQATPRLVVGTDVPPDFEPDPDLSDEPLPEVASAMWKASTSGGSTGMPKLIWENRSSLIDPLAPTPLLRIHPGDVMLHPAGAYHNAAFSQTNWGLCWGCHVILMERFDPSTWLSLVEQHQVAWSYLVPTMMSRILALPDEVRTAADVSSVRTVMHMAAPCPAWVKQAFIDWFGPDAIWEIYGGTEGYGATMIGGTEWLEHRGSVGLAPPRTEIRDDHGDIMETGAIGTVWFHPPAWSPLGHDPEVAQTFGDMGYLDEDGYLYLADRRTDMILSGGVNLYPAEIEGAIEQFPGVVSVGVIGLPDPDFGAKAHAIVELAPGEPGPEPGSLVEFLETRLSRSKLPYSIEFVRSPLRDEAGKIRRKNLREEREGKTTSDYTRLR